MKIGIIGAMNKEVDTLKAKMEHPVASVKAGRTFYEGRLGGVDCVVVVCGIGKVNAALCVQILADCFGVTHVINTGIAGSLDSRLDIGDIVISTDLMYHDFDTTAFGDAWGQVSGVDVLAFPVDELLARTAMECCEAFSIRCTRGRVASGDQFICDGGVKAQIIEHTGASCTEMEGAAIAHTAWRNGVPFVVIRAISDKADDSAEMDYPTFEAIAAKRCAAVTMGLVKQLKKTNTQ